MTPDPLPALFGQSTVVIVIVIAILGAVGWALRRMSSQRHSHQTMATETALSLGGGRSLVIVAVEGRRLLLGVTPTQIALVTELGGSFDVSLDRSLHTESAAAPPSAIEPSR